MATGLDIGAFRIAYLFRRCRSIDRHALGGETVSTSMKPLDHDDRDSERVDPLAETWTAQDAAGPEQESLSFGQSTRHRRTLMGVVVLGGAAAVIGMRLLTGGPLAVQAHGMLDGAIDGFIHVEAQRDRASLADASSLARLLDSPGTDQQVPLAQLRTNPFRKPAALTGDVLSGDGMGNGASEHVLQRRLDIMEVTMVLRGQVTVALIDGMRMPVGRAVDTDEGFQARLISVGSGSVEVELVDPSSGTRVSGLIPIGSRDKRS